MVKTMVRQAVPLQPMEVYGGADIHLQPVEDPMLEQVDVPEGSCDPMESPCWSRFPSAAVAPGRGAHAGAGLLAGPVAPWEGPHTGAEECEEEGAAETARDELTATPAPRPLRCTGGGGGEVRSEDEPRKREGWGEGVP